MVPEVYGVKILMVLGDLWNGYNNEERKYLSCVIQYIFNGNRYISIHCGKS